MIAPMRSGCAVMHAMAALAPMVHRPREYAKALAAVVNRTMADVVVRHPLAVPVSRVQAIQAHAGSHVNLAGPAAVHWHAGT